VLTGQLGEVGTAFDGGFQFIALGFGGNQDVAGVARAMGTLLCE